VLSILLFFAFVKLVRYSIYVFMGALIILVVLSWVAPRHHPAMPFFDGLTRPFTRPARRVIPPIGGIDISPIFVLLFFQILLMIPVAWFEMAAKNMVDRALP
jgi:YggT family protein